MTEWSQEQAQEAYATFPAFVDGKQWCEDRVFHGKFHKLFQCLYHNDDGVCVMPRVEEYDGLMWVERDVLPDGEKSLFSGRLNHASTTGAIRLSNNKSFLCKVCIARITEFIRHHPTDMFFFAAYGLTERQAASTPGLEDEVHRALQRTPVQPGMFPLFEAMLRRVEDDLDLFQNQNAYAHDFDMKPPRPYLVTAASTDEDSVYIKFAEAYLAFFQPAVAGPARKMMPPRIGELASYYLDGLPEQNYPTLTIALKLLRWFDDGHSTQEEQREHVNRMIAQKKKNASLPPHNPFLTETEMLDDDLFGGV